jgi:hypothetical protein
MRWATKLSMYCCVFFAVGALPAFGATLYVEPNSVSVLKGDTISVAVRLDTDEGECINAVDAIISYSEGVEAVDVSRGRSILSIWVEDPAIHRDERRITLAGGIPNGYCGRIPGDPSLTNVIADLVFRAPGFTVGSSDNVQSLIRFEGGTRAFLNDGAGTEAPLRLLDGSIDVIQEVGSTTQDAWRDAVRADTIIPQPFSIELAQKDDAFGGRYFIVFNTTDKQSGIDHYEVIEESRDDLLRFSWGRADAPWVETESPYVLEDQSLKSVIRVKAVDKAGNERIAVLIPDDAVRPLDTTLLLALGAGVLLALLFIGAVAYVAYRMYRRSRKSGQDDIPI